MTDLSLIHIFYPLIEESEKLDLKNLEEGYEHVKAAFPEFSVIKMHGRMKPAEKEEVMRQFVANEAQIMVSTTVIEVGVNVPNASVMVIAVSYTHLEALQPDFKLYQAQVKKNAAALASAFMDKGYKVVSNGTDNHIVLVDLRRKFPNLTGRVAEELLVAVNITTNKNMVPFDDRSPFQTSGLRFGSAAITTRGAKEELMGEVVELIDHVLSNPEDDKVVRSVKEQVNRTMKGYPLFAW